jgi:hypothetical protein
MTMFGSSIDFLTKQAKDLSNSGNRSISRITSGGDALKLAAMDKKSGNLGKVIRITVDNLSKQDSIRFFQNAISFMKFQEEAITYADKLYSEMQILAERAETSTTSLERKLLNEQFVKLRDQATALNQLTFNGKALFDELAGSVEYTIDFSSQLFRDSSTWNKDMSVNQAGFKTFANTQNVVYDKGILVLDVSTGVAGEQFVFGYYESGGKSDQIEYVQKGYYHYTEQDKTAAEIKAANEVAVNGLLYHQSTSSSDGVLSDGFAYVQKSGVAGSNEVTEGGLVYEHKSYANGDALPSDQAALGGYLYYLDNSGNADLSQPVADLSKPVADLDKPIADLNDPALDKEKQEVLTEIDDDLPLKGIDPIFNSSQFANFNQLDGSSDRGINTWDTTGSASTSDFDRFLIEWGPDQETSFRFIPLSEEVVGGGWVNKGDSTNRYDNTFDNENSYLNNLGLSGNAVGSLWDIDGIEDKSFNEKYKFLQDSNPPADQYDQIYFDPNINYRATKQFFGSQGDVKLNDSDPSRDRTMQLRVNGKTIYQVRAKYFKPKIEDTNVGNINDFSTHMKPLGLGLLLDKQDENYEKLSILETSDATRAIAALKLEKEGLLEQMGTLSNNLSRVMSSMDAVNKQLGIQEDIIDPAPDEVLIDELKNLTRTREMRAFNASLMNKVVQINHDMVNLLLT